MSSFCKCVCMSVILHLLGKQPSPHARWSPLLTDFSSHSEVPGSPLRFSLVWSLYSWTPEILGDFWPARHLLQLHRWAVMGHSVEGGGWSECTLFGSIELNVICGFLLFKQGPRRKDTDQQTEPDHSEIPNRKIKPITYQVVKIFIHSSIASLTFWIRAHHFVTAAQPYSSWNESLEKEEEEEGGERREKEQNLVSYLKTLVIVASCHGNFHGQSANITSNFIPTNTGPHQSSTLMLFFLGIMAGQSFHHSQASSI